MVDGLGRQRQAVTAGERILKLFVRRACRARTTTVARLRDDEPVHAYVDESARVSPPGFYVLAAVIVPTDAIEMTRQRVREAVPKRQLRFHWRDEAAARRRQFIKAIAPMTLTALAVVSSPMDRKRTSERVANALPNSCGSSINST